MPKIKKETLIKREEEKLLEIFSALDDDTLKTALPLIKNAAWCSVSLDEIRAQIDSAGAYVENWQNGETQKGLRPSALVNTYINLVKSHNSIIKILLTLMPKDAPGGKDALAGFLLKN